MKCLNQFLSNQNHFFFSFVRSFVGTFVLNWYEVLFNCACIKGNTDSLSCFWTEGFVSSRVPELCLKLAFVCKIIKCYLLVTRIQQITFRFFFQCSKRFFFFNKISLFCNRSILSGNRYISQNIDVPFLLRRIVKEKLSVYVISNR